MSTKTTKITYNPNGHPFHILDASPHPFNLGITLGLSLYSLVLMVNNKITMNGMIILTFLLINFFLTITNWFYDIVIEGTYEGQHTLAVQQNLRFGMVLFIVSEIMFFFSFFWAFFHSSISPAVSIGCVWPPVGIEVLNPWGLPFLNTIILLSSGVSVTWAHRAITADPKDRPQAKLRLEVIVALTLTIALGLLFTALQKYEYIHATFTIADGIYGSTFFVTTGFHGLHVIIGTLFLFICLLRHIQYHFTREHHVGLEAAIWYWHFVDVVWLFLFVSIYWYGS